MSGKTKTLFQLMCDIFASGELGSREPGKPVDAANWYLLPTERGHVRV